MVALFAVPIGLLTDRMDRRPLLAVGLLLYAAAGMAPIFLQTLPAILASRCAVGLAEAVVMTAGTAMLGDLFDGPRREHWFSVQTGSATLVSVIALALGGALGEISWRTPFFAYALPSILAVLVWTFVQKSDRGGRVSVTGPDAWSPLVAPILATLFASVAFYVVVIQLPFLLTSRGFAAPSQIGMGAAIAAAAVPIGSALFRLLSRSTVSTKLALSFLLSAVGFWLMGHRGDYAGTLAGAFINGMGSGLALPTLLTWATGAIGAEFRGRSTGAWNTAFFLGQFFSPIAFGLIAAAQGPDRALTLMAGACALALLVTLGARVAVGTKSARSNRLAA
ncbi:MFS transporter [soil metagenome]